MTSPDRDAIRAKIAKLMAMANDGRGNENEAEAAMRHASKLMAKHNIELAEICDREGRKPVYKWATVFVPAGAPEPVKTAPMWFNWLTYGVGVFTDCRTSISYKHQYGACVRFDGDETDVEYAVWLTKTLRDMCRREATAFGGCRGEKEAFRKGFASRVQARMKSLVQERHVELDKVKLSTGTALVVVNDKIALRDETFGKQVCKTSTARSSFSGWGAGSKAGDRANFNRPVGGNNFKQLGG